MQLRDKVLVLLDSWQEAFGGPSGKHPHYYWAYEELRVSMTLIAEHFSMSVCPEYGSFIEIKLDWTRYFAE